MPRLTTIVFFAVTVVGCANPPLAKGAESTVVPAGLLGHPIGTWLRIEGVRLEQGKVGAGALLVDRVSDRQLATPVGIQVENVTFPTGTRCTISGYETGRWIGLPPGVERSENLAPRQAAWQFQRYFLATSVQAPPELVAAFRGEHTNR